jgi:hypothetical protein
MSETKNRWLPCPGPVGPTRLGNPDWRLTHGGLLAVAKRLAQMLGLE